MQIRENVSLLPFNTFGIDAATRYFSAFSNVDDLFELSAFSPQPSTQKFILGGGSNLLFTKNYDGLILKNEIKGIELLHEDNDYVYVKAGAGEVWHQFVIY